MRSDDHQVQCDPLPELPELPKTKLQLEEEAQVQAEKELVQARKELMDRFHLIIVKTGAKVSTAAPKL